MYTLEVLLRKTLRVVEKGNWILMHVNDMVLHNMPVELQLNLIKGKATEGKGTTLQICMQT